MINRPFMTLIQREIWRFLGLYKQTLIPSVISSGLYIIVFGDFQIFFLPTKKV